MGQVNNFDFNEYNEIYYKNKPFRHAFNLKQFADQIDLVEERNRLKDGSANYVRYGEFNKEMYLPPEKLINPTYNLLFENFYNSGIRFVNLNPKISLDPITKLNSTFKTGIHPLFEPCINKYIENLIE
jgi:hypothetical protein